MAFNVHNGGEGSNIHTAAPVERMRIKGDGNVGIGTADPQCRLHTYVNGNNYTRIQSSTGTEAALGIL